MTDQLLMKTLARVADFYDRRKVGDVGPLGFRRSTDLGILFSCLAPLIKERIIVPDRTKFLDLGCADGRVNLFLSYLVKSSVGIEIDEWTLEEYCPLKTKLLARLKEDGLLMPPANVSLFQGDSGKDEVYLKIGEKTGILFNDFDIFYTYLVMQDECAEIIADKAKKGAIFMVYGLSKILPKHRGLALLEHISPLKGILAVYRKI